jgi:hypothetical protein
MRKLFTMTFVSFFCGLMLIAQERPGLLFTEFSVTPNTQANYYEITNMEDTVIDLREFTLRRFIHSELPPVGEEGFFTRCIADFSLLLDESQAMLEPGESFTVMPVAESRVTDINSFWFGRNNTRPGSRDSADFINYVIEWNWDTDEDRIAFGWEKDSAFIDLLIRPTDKEATFLYRSRDTLAVDALFNVFDENGKTTQMPNLPIAGVERSTQNYVHVRKSTVTKSSLDWNASRGVDASDSEWMTIYQDYNNPWNPSFFTTIGTHGDFSIDFSSDVLSIDHDAKTITVPWGIRKGTFNVRLSPSKGLIDEIDFGPGMAYRYREQSDSASSACMLGDTLWVFAAGADLETAGYAIIPADSEVGDAMVLPRRTLIEDEFSEGVFNYTDDIPGDEYAIGSNNYAYECRYYVTENGEGADSITWIPFAERVDTLFKYLEKAPNATWEIDWVDDIERVDLKEGDKLIVTNGSATEEYYLSLRPIAKGEDASLTAITWPDVDKDDAGWDSDTIPGFSSTVYQYTIEVPYGSTNIPALSFFKSDVNAKVEMQSASSLRGGIENRTTTITVTSADGLTSNQYRITFKAEINPAAVQPYFAEPIISEITWVLWWSASFVEIANVGNQPLDLGKYMLAGGNKTSPANVITSPIGVDSIPYWRDRYFKYIPGKKYSTYQYWADNHVGMVVDDPDILPIIEPGECFVLAQFKNASHTTEGHARYFDPSMYDVLFSNAVENQWGEVNARGPFPFKYIFSIDGDSILDGKKAMTDPDDFLVVDVFGDFENTFTGEVGGVGTANFNNSTYRRKPSNYLPGTVPTYNTGQTAEEHSWTVLPASAVDPAVGDQVKYLTSDIGNFTHDPITLYMSTVSSMVYVVDEGYKTEDDLKIKGVLSGTTSASFIDNLILNDMDQGLSVISSTSGDVLGDDEQLAAGDTLRVVSKDGENVTKYTVELGALDSNATLVAVDNVYTIDIDGTEGTVSGIPMDITIEEVLDNVEVPALAMLNVIDAEGNLVPLQVMDMSDTTYRKTMLMGVVYFEVIAQDGSSITYLLDQGILSSDAWVTSNVYTVNQENWTIADILQETTVDILLSNLVPSGNALMVVYDKAGFKRDSGYVSVDDVVGVTSEDGSKTVTYSLRQLGYTPGNQVWVKSDVYLVNESATSIDDIPSNTDVSEFLNNIEVPGGAYVKLMDAADVEKEEGVILGTDKLEVTSEDQSNVVVYTLNLLVSVHNWAMDDIKVYPNPVSDLLHVEGLEGNCRIELTSMSGQKLRAVQTSDPIFEISVSSLSAGMYILRVTDNHLNLKVMQVIISE